MSVTNFPVTANYSAFASGLILRGDVLFTPVFHEGDIAKGTGLTPPTGFVPTPVPAKLVNGVLMGLDGSTVHLQSNTPDLNLATPLYYSVQFDNVTASTMNATVSNIVARVTPVQLNGFSFIAPTDSTAIDLISVTPAPNAAEAQGIFNTVVVANITDATSFARTFLSTVSSQSEAQAYFGSGGGSGGGGGEPPITPGTTSQYWRGDKTWQTLNATAAGAEPAIAPGNSSQYWRGDKTWATFPSIPASEPPIAPGTTAQFWRGDKTWQPISSIASGAGGGIVRSVIPLSTASTIGATPLTDYVVLCSFGAAPKLPAQSGNTNSYTFKNIQSSGVIFVLCQPGETIEGNVNYTLAEGESITLITGLGTDWKAI